MRKYWALMLAGTVACASMSVACGDDDDDDTKPLIEAGEGGNPEGGGEGGPDGGCTFATYVIDLINTKTTAQAAPDTTLGAGCKDSTDQAEFKSLFP